MTRTPPHSKSEKAVRSLPVFLADSWAAFFVPPTVRIGGYACVVSQSLVVLVIALSMPFGYTCVAISGKENDTMPATKNLCAQISLELHQKNSDAREQSGLTTAQYITNLLMEYYEMKENGGNTAMTNNKSRTLAFQIEEDLFQRIKAHLERETRRTGRKLTQREFVLGLVEAALDEAERQAAEDSPEQEAGVGPCEAQDEDDSAQPQEEKGNPTVQGA